MTAFRTSKIIAAIALTAASIGSASAASYTEDFNAAFPTWESNWFGSNSTARNYYCSGSQNCSNRGNNLDGLWVLTDSNSWAVDVKFLGAFADSLTSFKLDVAGYSPTTLQAFDKSDALIFSQDVALTYGAYGNPGTYASYTINSTNGISHFSFSGYATGNTSIDNLVAVTKNVTAVPEPESLALMLAGLVALGLVATGRRA